EVLSEKRAVGPRLPPGHTRDRTAGSGRGFEALRRDIRGVGDPGDLAHLAEHGESSVGDLGAIDTIGCHGEHLLGGALGKLRLIRRRWLADATEDERPGGDLDRIGVRGLTRRDADVQDVRASAAASVAGEAAERDDGSRAGLTGAAAALDD